MHDFLEMLNKNCFGLNSDPLRQDILLELAGPLMSIPPDQLDPGYTKSLSTQ